MDVEFVRHQFEDRKDGVVTRNKFKLGVRHIQVIYMFLCAASLGALRGSTGIAVLALTDVSRKNDSYIHVYDWDAKVQGGILSSYLFGYAAMLVPAELLLRRIGGKHIMTAVLVITGALTMAMPTIVSKKVLHIPLRSMLRSRQVWAVTSAHVASNVVFVFFMFYIPVFLIGSGNDIKASGWQTIIPFATFWLIRMTTSSTIDWFLGILRMGFQVKISYIRKLINLIGAGGVVTGLLVLPNLSAGWGGLLIFVMTVTLGMMGLQLSGFLDTYKDMSDNYNGTLLMISRTVASFVAAFLPFIIGFIFNKDMYQLANWRLVFHMIAGVYMICNTIYIIFGSSERQYWDGIVVKNKFGYHNAMIDTNNLELEEFNDLKKTYDNDVINSDI